jgi:hypothetical protein
MPNTNPPRNLTPVALPATGDDHYGYKAGYSWDLAMYIFS